VLTLSMGAYIIFEDWELKKSIMEVVK